MYMKHRNKRGAPLSYVQFYFPIFYIFVFVWILSVSRLLAKLFSAELSGWSLCVRCAVVVHNQVDFKNRFDKFLTALISPFIFILSYFLLLFFDGSSSLDLCVSYMYTYSGTGYTSMYILRVWMWMYIYLFTILYECESMREGRRSSPEKYEKQKIKLVSNNILYAENDCVWYVHVEKNKIKQNHMYTLYAIRES